jgi:hypothetical protein
MLTYCVVTSADSTNTAYLLCTCCLTQTLRYYREKQGDNSTTHILLHTTAAGSMPSDVLEDFLAEHIADQYVPQPLDLKTLFDFLKVRLCVHTLWHTFSTNTIVNATKSCL